MRMRASDVAQITGGTLVGPDTTVDGICFDSRNLRVGQCFVALVAERDGHAFVDAAFSAGAPLCIVEPHRLVSREMPDGGARVEVANTDQALTALGIWARSQLDRTASRRVVGVTGSAGKTSTKDFIVAVLRAGFRHSYASELSFNNDIGVPTTLLNAPDDCDAIVIEMGMRGLGEITRLCEVARPHIGVITSIGEAHSERVGGIEGVAKAKGELLRALPKDGVSIVSADDPRSLAAAQTSQARVLTFGKTGTSDVRFTVADIDAYGCITMTLQYKEATATAHVPVPGEHMASNAAAAIATGIALGLELSVCAAAIENAEVSYMRMQWEAAPNGVRIMNDAYNANPDSMIAAMKTLSTVPASRRIAVVGKMAEIADAPERHKFVANVADQLGLDLWAVDTDLYGVTPINVETAAQKIAQLSSDAVVLLKGSRVAGLERIVELLGVAPPRKK